VNRASPGGEPGPSLLAGAHLDAVTAVALGGQRPVLAVAGLGHAVDAQGARAGEAAAVARGEGRGGLEAARSRAEVRARVPLAREHLRRAAQIRAGRGRIRAEQALQPGPHVVAGLFVEARVPVADWGARPDLVRNERVDADDEVRVRAIERAPGVARAKAGRVFVDRGAEGRHVA